jgi:gluconate kinase
MNFFRKHLAPTLHNAVGTIIAAAMIACVALIKPLRDAITVTVPSWTILALCGSFALMELFLFRRRRHRRIASLLRIQQQRAADQELHRRNIANLQSQLAQVTLEREDAIKQKEGFMFRLQELSKRLGIVASIRPVSGAARTRQF